MHNRLVTLRKLEIASYDPFKVPLRQIYVGPIVHNTRKSSQHNVNKPQQYKLGTTQKKQAATQWKQVAIQRKQATIQYN